MQVSFGINGGDNDIVEMKQYHKNGNQNTMRLVFFTPLDIREGDELSIINLRGFTSIKGKVLTVSDSKNSNMKSVIIAEPEISYNSED